MGITSHNSKISTVLLKDSAVTTVKIADLAVTGVKIAVGAVTGGKIQSSAVTETKIDDLAVTNGKLAGSIALSKLTDFPEANATSDQTGAEIKTAYEAETDAFTDTKNTKLSGIATSAEVNPTLISQAEAEAGTDTNERVITAVRIKQAIDALASGGAITGEVRMWGGTEVTVPSGWAICDGTSLDTTVEADLFAVIGYLYGGSGANFNVPDFQTDNRFPRGATNDAGRGTEGGESTHALSIAELASHTHTQNSHTHTQDAHDHGMTVNDSGTLGVYQPMGTSTTTPFTGTLPTDSTTATNQSATPTNQSTGSGTAHENKPPFLDIHFMIKK